MSLSKPENGSKPVVRRFQDTWEDNYLVTNVCGRAVCLVCRENIYCKEYNVRRHYTTNHAEHFHSLVGDHRSHRITELRKALEIDTSPQTTDTDEPVRDITSWNLMGGV